MRSVSTYDSRIAAVRMITIDELPCADSCSCAIADEHLRLRRRIDRVLPKVIDHADDRRAAVVGGAAHRVLAERHADARSIGMSSR